jgi:membrane protein implicated in regulation of membrane protease activity
MNFVVPGMTWWVWLLAGFVCLAGELLTPGLFYLAFLGVSACVVALIAWISPQSALWFQVLCFSVVMVGLALFRRQLLEKFNIRPPSIPVDQLNTEVAVAAEAIAPGAQGRAELRGASWTARNVGDVPIAAGDRCPVTRVDGLVLEIRRN